jgi:hypothetical protein
MNFPVLEYDLSERVTIFFEFYVDAFNATTVVALFH